MRGAIAAAVYEINSSYVVEREAAQTRDGGFRRGPPRFEDGGRTAPLFLPNLVRREFAGQR